MLRLKIIEVEFLPLKLKYYVLIINEIINKVSDIK